MPLSKKHKQKSKEKILYSAIKLFTSNGFNKVSIDKIMHHAGMTRGAFYAHFDSKETLYSEAILAAALESPILKSLNVCGDKSSELEKFVAGYLSKAHINQKAPYICPLAFLATDVANEEQQVRQTYTKVFEGLVKNFIEKSENRINQETALAIVAMMIGSVAVGRALTNKKTVSALLNSSKTVAYDLLASR